MDHVEALSRIMNPHILQQNGYPPSHHVRSFFFSPSFPVCEEDITFKFNFELDVGDRGYQLHVVDGEGSR